MDLIGAITGLPKWVRLAIAAVAGALLIWGWWALWLHGHDKRHDAQREAQAAPAREKAADERVTDATTNAKNEEDLHHAIDSAPKGGTISPAAHALACERLRKLGRIPASCGSASSDGSQAHPH